MVIVVCTGGEGPPSPFIVPWLDSCDQTIAADGGLALLRSLGRKANLWIGDGDSLGGVPEDWSDWFLESRLLERNKDDTDTEAAVREAINRGATEVWLVGGSGGRTDHWWANLRLAASCPQLTRWLTAREEAWILGPGKRVGLPAGTVSVFPLGDGPWSVRSEGLRWGLETVDFGRWHSLSNEVSASGGAVEVLDGRVMVLRPYPEELRP